MMIKIKIFDENGKLIGWKIPVSKKYIKDRKKEFSNMDKTLKG